MEMEKIRAGAMPADKAGNGTAVQYIIGTSSDGTWWYRKWSEG